MLRSTSVILCTLALAVNGLNYQRTENIGTTIKRDETRKVAERDGQVREFPCPDEAEFLPCTCIADDDFKMDAECSAVTSDAELAKAFTALQSFCDYRSLTIAHTTATNLDTLTKDTFGCVGFETIEITGTSLKIIEDGTFANSEATLTTLNLNNNAINDFPFESLTEFTVLKTLNLDDNLLPEVQNINSESLVTLNLNNNPNLNIAPRLFEHAPSLESLLLHNCGIVDLTADMFMALDSIKSIDLSMNIITQLRENVINVPQSTLESLDFSDNPLYDIAVGAINIDGLVPGTCTLSFVNTEFVELCEITWGEYVNHLAAGAIHLAGNPLRCGCDMAWFFDNLNLYQRLEPTTSCSDGSLVKDLIPEVFTYHCDPMPAGICPTKLDLEVL